MLSPATLTRLALCLSSLASAASAWPRWLPDVDALVVRAPSADASSNTASAGSTASGVTPSATPASASSSASSSSSSSSGSSTGSGSGSATSQGVTSTNLNTAQSTSSGTGSSNQTSITSFPLTAGAGGVSMLTPATSVTPTPLYMIGDNVTFGWNYTSLLATPTAVDVLLTCTVNSATWTLTSNMTFQTQVSYVWNSANTNDDVENPLLTDMYTMIIKDTNADITAMPTPGYLSTYSQFYFGMYKNLPYVSYDQWTCPGSCSSASGPTTHAIAFLFGMSLITFLSFTWFVTGLELH